MFLRVIGGRRCPARATVRSIWNGECTNVCSQEIRARPRLPLSNDRSQSGRRGRLAVAPGLLRPPCGACLRQAEAVGTSIICRRQRIRNDSRGTPLAARWRRRREKVVLIIGRLEAITVSIRYLKGGPPQRASSRTNDSSTNDRSNHWDRWVCILLPPDPTMEPAQSG